MSLFPEDNILTKEIESWREFANSLKSNDDRELFLEIDKRLSESCITINAKGAPSQLNL
jgi:hypothetical protein